jgi:hypothetical protein
LKTLIGILALLIVVTGKVEATTIIVSNGELIGAEDVLVKGILYDVAFVEGSCESLFGGCNDAYFMFHTLADAITASYALLDQVFLNGPSGAFDDTPELTYGCETPGYCQALTPYQFVSPFTVLLGDATNYTGNSNDYAQSNEAGIRYNTTLGPTQVYAKWSVASVPDVTGTMSLLGVSVALMLALRRAI